MKKYILISAGFISFALGIVGIFIPILPTTPFVLLSATCFLYSSKKLYSWIINHKIFGRYVKYYIQFHAISMKSKIISISLLWIVILCSIIFFTNLLWLRIILGLIAIGVTIHLLTIRTLTKEMIEKYKKTFEEPSS